MIGIGGILLSDVRHLDRWTLAPLGSIVSTSLHDGSPIVGLRTEYDSPHGGSDGLLLLNGDDQGLIISDAELGRQPALDITALVRFVVRDPTPFDIMNARPAMGSLLWRSLTGDAFYMAAAIEEILPPHRQPTMVCIQGVELGKCVRGHVVLQSKGIASKAELERIPFSFSPSGV